MISKKIIITISVLFFSFHLFAQKDSTKVKTKQNLIIQEGVYKPLAPAKAAFYSAIFPGLGQIYNKKYWKAPLVWGAIATPTYFYLNNNSEYKRYRTAYKLRKSGFQDEFTNDLGEVTVSLETLERAQEQLRENRDLSLMWGVIIYVLQIVEASVNAHLIQFNTDDNLSLKPSFVQDPILFDAPKVGFTLKYTF
ncbi:MULTISPECIES: DUF5683 domain-containing protein [unclassified Polaribacter]|uniref:DUF5683 domain-containing protein n=1 Tax=unclassified Polaribacter TaxID=196858 RepID=UPI00098A7A7B|nr:MULTISPECIES: DUF5683 domain-containing protein [unclassified Polaribacter]AQS92692.1 hypothetical protein BXQ17_00785 [Polaribacter sp. BM10]